MKRVHLLLLTTFACQEPVDPLAGVGTIEVKVTALEANDSELVLSQAHVYLVGDSATTTTTVDGTHVLSNVPRGERLVAASSQAGAARTKTVGVIDEPVSLELDLEAAACVVGRVDDPDSEMEVEVLGAPPVRVSDDGRFHVFVPKGIAVDSIRLRRRGGATEEMAVTRGCGEVGAEASTEARLCQDECCGRYGQPCCVFGDVCGDDALRCHLGACGCGAFCVEGEVECCRAGDDCVEGHRRRCERAGECVRWGAWEPSPAEEERADYQDDDCDGDVDEDWRITLCRRHGANPTDWNEPGADSDHCFSLSSEPTGGCVHAPAAGSQVGLLPYRRDGRAIRIYALDAVENQPDVALIGDVHVALLMECFRAGDTIHYYLYRESQWFRDSIQDGFDCAPVGYVRSEQRQSVAADDLPVYVHHHENATDQMYGPIIDEAADIGFENKGLAFFAWKPPLSDCACGDGLCGEDETAGSCPSDCGAERGETTWLRWATTEQCSTATAGWHLLDATGTNRWTYGTCCEVADPGTPEAYGYEVAYTDFTIRRAGTYRVTTSLPAVETCTWDACVTTGALYSMSGADFVTTATVDQRANLGASVTLADELFLEPGPLRVAVYDRAIEVDAAACSACSACDSCGATEPCSENRRFRRVISGEIFVSAVE